MPCVLVNLMCVCVCMPVTVGNRLHTIRTWEGTSLTCRAMTLHPLHWTTPTSVMLYYARCDCFSKQHEAKTKLHSHYFDFLALCFIFVQGAPTAFRGSSLTGSSLSDMWWHNVSQGCILCTVIHRSIRNRFRWLLFQLVFHKCSYLFIKVQIKPINMAWQQWQIGERGFN